MRRIGIMGGTFNPVHNAHLILAEQAYEVFELEEVVFIPSKHPPHKSNSELASDRHRFNMLKLATEGNSHFTVSDIELKREGLTYTVDTLNALRAENEGIEYYFIIGGDSLMHFKDWRMPEKIVQLSKIVATGRGEFTLNAITDQIAHLNELYHADIQYFDTPNMIISSSTLRSRAKKGSSIRYFVPEAVNDYILKNNLYK